MGIIRSRERFLIRMRALYARDRGKDVLINRMLTECYSDWGIHAARDGQPRKGWVRLIQATAAGSMEVPYLFETPSGLTFDFPG
jgi:hypothetical protein